MVPFPVYGLVPPFAIILTEPFEPPKQETGEVFDVVVRGVG
jgi:hypothetical protein